MFRHVHQLDSRILISTLGFNSILHYVFCSNCLGFVHWKLSVDTRITPITVSPPPFCFTFCSSLNLYTFFPSSRVRHLRTFYWTMILDTNIWVLVCLLLLGCFWTLSADARKSLCNNNPGVYLSLKYFYM